MQDDPVQYWQDLTANYAQMSDGELLDLAWKPEDLTEVARQVLRDEMKKRGLDARRTESPSRATNPVRLDRPAAVHWEPARFRHAPREDHEESELPHEFTWKTDVRECNTREEALDVAMVLKEAGIESWISTPNLNWGLAGPRIQVAADQLEQAQAVLANFVPPKPQEREEIPEFEIPTCPKCGAKDDVVLVSADPVNSWVCEACGAQWTEAEPSNPEGGGEDQSPTS